MIAKGNAFRGFLALAILCLACSPAVARGIPWYEKYGISKEELRQASAVPKLVNALKDSDPRTRKGAAKFLGGLRANAREAVPALTDALNDQHPGVRTEVAQTLGEIGPDAVSAAPALVRALGDKDADVRLQGVRSLQRMRYRGADFQAALQAMAGSDPHKRVKGEAAALLAAFATMGATPVKEEGSSLAAGPPAAGIDLPKTDRVNRYGVAVIIGNRHYASAGKSVPDVAFAHNDIDAVYRYVTGTLGFREGNVILLKDASQADLVATFGTHNNPKGKVYDWVRPGQSDVFVYYSGHGAPGLGDSRSYLLPVDADPNKVELNGYPLETLYANLAQLPAKSTTVVLDACFSGSTAAGYVVKNASSITLRPTEAKIDPARMTVITASGLSQVASWDEKTRHGLFTSHFLQGVSSAADAQPYGNSDGKVTLGELKRYLEEEVTYNARRSYGRDQNPQVNGDPKMVLVELR